MANASIQAAFERMWSHVTTALNGKVSTSRTINGKALSSNITLSASDVGAAKVTQLTVTLSKSSWSSNSVSVTASGVTASNTVIVSSAPASQEAYGTAGVTCTAQAANSLTFTCTQVPTTDLSVNLVILS